MAAPNITDQKFDELLNDVIKNLTERVLSLGYDSTPFSLHAAMWDTNENKRSWGSADIVDFPSDRNSVRVLLASVGRSMVASNNEPIAAYWTQKSKMEVMLDGKPSLYTGFLVIGMTSDHRFNAGFLAVDDHDQPVGANMFYTSNTDANNRVESDMLYDLFTAARKAMDGDSGDVTMGDGLVRDLFKKIGKEKKGDENEDVVP